VFCEYFMFKVINLLMFLFFIKRKTKRERELANKARYTYL